MENTEAFIQISSIDISLISAFVSICSFLVASYFAWRVNLSPPKLVGAFPYVIIWSFKGNDDKQSDEYLIPYTWLKNIGARPILVGDMRLTVYPQNGASFHLKPIHSVPLTAIEKPNTYSDFNLISLGEAPFSGFSISNSEQWKNTNAFPVSAAERALLKGKVKLVFEICKLGSNKYMLVLSENISFDDESFDWVKWLEMGGPEATYYYKIK